MDSRVSTLTGLYLWKEIHCYFQNKYSRPLACVRASIAHTSISESFISIRYSSSFGIRASKSSAKGRGCKLAVWVNACVSIGDPSTSFRRKAHNTKAVVINSDLFASCCPGQTRLPKPKFIDLMSSRRLPESSNHLSRWNFSGSGKTSGERPIDQ